MKFAVIGNPVGHSISPALHSAVYEQLGIDAKYDKIHVPEEDLGAFVDSLKRGQTEDGGEVPCGINVTIPHKIAILPFLDEISGDACFAGAVNTVVRESRRSGCSLSGFNTDMGGLLRALQGLGSGYKGNTVCIFGAGGAAFGAAVKASSESAKTIRLIARNKEKADKACLRAEEAAIGNVRIESVELTDGSIPQEAVADADVFINATPLGMLGSRENYTDFSFLDAMPKTTIVYDCVYIPADTPLVSEARMRGLQTENGLSMLVWQGLLSDVYFLRAAGETLCKPDEILNQEMFSYVYKILETSLTNSGVK